jgi:hypothetical protein
MTLPNFQQFLTSVSAPLTLYGAIWVTSLMSLILFCPLLLITSTPSLLRVARRFLRLSLQVLALELLGFLLIAVFLAFLGANPVSLAVIVLPFSFAICAYWCITNPDHELMQTFRSEPEPPPPPPNAGEISETAKKIIDELSKRP